MLKIAELAGAKEALEKKALRALEDAGVKPDMNLSLIHI